MTLVSIREASRLLGVSEATLRSWSNDGQIKPFITPGGHRRYHIEELKQLVAARNRRRASAPWLRTSASPPSSTTSSWTA